MHFNLLIHRLSRHAIRTMSAHRGKAGSRNCARPDTNEFNRQGVIPDRGSNVEAKIGKLDGSAPSLLIYLKYGYR
jgi:hypothetical protein